MVMYRSLVGAEVINHFSSKILIDVIEVEVCNCLTPVNYSSGVREQYVLKNCSNGIY